MSYQQKPRSDLASLLQIQKFGQSINDEIPRNYLPGKGGYEVAGGVRGYAKQPQYLMDPRAIEAEDRRLQGLRRLEQLFNMNNIRNEAYGFNQMQNIPERSQEQQEPNPLTYLPKLPEENQEEEAFEEDQSSNNLSRKSSQFHNLMNLPYAQPDKETSYANYWLQKQQGNESPKLSPFYKMMMKDEYPNMEECRDPFNCTEGAYIGLKSKLGEKFTKPFQEHIKRGFENIYNEKGNLEDSDLLKKLYNQEQDNRFSYLNYKDPKNYYLVPRKKLNDFVEEDDTLFMKHNDPKAHITRIRGTLSANNQKQLQSQWNKTFQNVEVLMSFPIENFVGKKEPKIQAKISSYNSAGYGKFANELNKEPLIGVGTGWSSKPNRSNFQQYHYPEGTTQEQYLNQLKDELFEYQ